MKEPIKMVKVWDKLTPDDRVIICAQLREHTVQYSGMHLGLLPFVPVGAVLGVLNMVAASKPDPTDNFKGRRRVRVIASKIAGVLNAASQKPLHLDDGKVARRFGSHPERGQPMKWLPLEVVTVGFRNRFGNVEPDDDVHVYPVVSLKFISKNHWAVNVSEKHRAIVERWLVDNLR